MWHNPLNINLTKQQQADVRQNQFHIGNPNAFPQDGSGNSWTDAWGKQQSLPAQQQQCSCVVVRKDADDPNSIIDSNGYYVVKKVDCTFGYLPSDPVALMRMRLPSGAATIPRLKEGDLAWAQWMGVTYSSPSASDDGYLLLGYLIQDFKRGGLKIKNGSPDTATPWALMQVTGMGYDGGSDDLGFYLIIDYPDKLDFGTPSSEWPTNYAWSYLWGHKFLINDEQPLPAGEFKILYQTDPCYINIDDTDPRDWSLGHTLSIDGGGSWMADIDAGETTPYMSMGSPNSKKGGDGNNYNVIPVSLIGSEKGFTNGWTQKVGDGYATQYTIDTPNGTVLQWTFPQGNQSSKYFTTVGDDGDDLQKWKFQQGGSYLVTILIRVRGKKRDSTIDNTTKPAKCWLSTKGSFAGSWASYPNTLGNNALVATTEITKTPRLENPSSGVYTLEFDYDEIPILAILPMTFIVGNAQVDEDFWLEITNQDADGTYLPLEIMWSGLTVVKIS